MAGIFKKGDVVKLNSGGPKMTIVGDGEDCDYEVVWFDKNDVDQTAEFDEELLESVPSGSVTISSGDDEDS